MMQKIVNMIDENLRRTKNVKIHISLTLVYKGIAIFLNYLLVPLVIKFLGIEQYGIWVTIYSLASWAAFFDIGIGNGLRNKLSVALSLNNIRLARVYISTGYGVLSFIALMMFLGFIPVSIFMNWNKVLNSYLFPNKFLFVVVMITVFFFLLNFIISLSKQLFYALQEASLVALAPIILNVFMLLFVLLHAVFNIDSKLLYISLVFGLSGLLSNVLLTISFFIRHKELTPSFKYIDISRAKSIGTLGIRFFVIQIAALVIFSTDNMIITQILGPKEVTPYSVVFKLFSGITMLHSVVMAPLWSAYTDAYSKGDMKWIKSVLKKMNIMMIPIVLVVLVVFIFAKTLIRIWIGTTIIVSTPLISLMGVYVIIVAWNNIYAYFVNGIGKIKPQMYSSILAAIINIPLSIFFARNLGMGIAGVVLGSIVSLSLFAILGPIQTYNILKRKGNNE